MLKINNLYLRYTREFYALYDINIDIADNEKVAFIGQDESGKTSLLRIIAKLEKLTKGELFIRDIPIDKLDYKTDISAGYIPATPVFLEKKSVYENFKYILTYLPLRVKAKALQKLPNFLPWQVLRL